MKTISRYSLARKQHGSVFILVVAVLATLILLTLSFAYSSRIELTAARNWSNGVQARMAAVSGIPLYNSSGEAQGGIVSPKSSISTTRNASVLSSTTDPGSEIALQGTELAPVPLRLLPASFAGLVGLTKLGDTKVQTSKPEKSKTEHFLGEQTAMAAIPPQMSSGGLNNIMQDPAAQMAQQMIVDTAGLININAVVPTSVKRLQSSTHFQTMKGSNAQIAATPPFVDEDVLAKLIQEVMDGRHITGPPPQQLAHAIALRRFGGDGLPGTGGSDDDQDARDAAEKKAKELGRTVLADFTHKIQNPAVHDQLDNNLNGRADEPTDVVDDLRESLSDPRQKPNGDDQPYGAVSELLTIPGMTPNLFEALAPWLTVFSISYEAFVLPGDSPEARGAKTGDIGWPKVDPNTSSAESIYQTLKARFPHADEALLGQFTVNIIDRRDVDDVPTTLIVDGQSFTGIELSPCINEVCPDTSSIDEDDDNGEYIELFNPYQKSFNLTGWSLQGAGTAVTLDGTLPENGFLVITDDFNDQNDPEAIAGKENGSFYSIFHVAEGGPKRQLKEVSGLSLPNDAGSIKLVNPQGQVVDVFEWQGGKWSGQTRSFQRIDPRLRYSERATATPLEPNGKATVNKDAQEALNIQQNWQNQPFRSGLDVLLVTSAFVQHAAAATETQSANIGHPYALPGLVAVDNGELDVRLIDCFQTGVVLPTSSEREIRLREAGLGKSNETNLHASGIQNVHNDERTSREREADEEALAPTCDSRFGAINLNTAPLAILATLPGMTQRLLASIAERRGVTTFTNGISQKAQSTSPNDEQFWRVGNPFGPPVWPNLSDFLLDETIWKDKPLYERVDAVYSFLPLLATHSQALAIGTENLNPDHKLDRRPALTRAQRLLAFDRGRLETLSFHYEGLGFKELGDSDMRLAAPLSKVKPAFDENKIVQEAFYQSRDVSRIAENR